MPNLLESRQALLPPSQRGGKREDDYAVCGRCNCSWFEEIRLSRVDKNQIVITGQAVPKLTDQFVLLRCGKCGELHEPPIAHSNSPAYKQYIVMLKELDG